MDRVRPLFVRLRRRRAQYFPDRARRIGSAGRTRGRPGGPAADGGEAAQLSRGPDEDRDPSWSPDGKRIVYCSGPPAMPVDVYVYDLAKRDRSKVSKEPGPWRRPRMSPNGQILMTRQNEDGSD